MIRAFFWCVIILVAWIGIGMSAASGNAFGVILNVVALMIDVWCLKDALGEME